MYALIQAEQARTQHEGKSETKVSQIDTIYAHLNQV